MNAPEWYTRLNFLERAQMNDIVNVAYNKGREDAATYIKTSDVKNILTTIAVLSMVGFMTLHLWIASTKEIDDGSTGTST